AIPDRNETLQASAGMLGTDNEKPDAREVSTRKREDKSSIDLARDRGIALGAPVTRKGEDKSSIDLARDRGIALDAPVTRKGEDKSSIGLARDRGIDLSGLP